MRKVYIFPLLGLIGIFLGCGTDEELPAPAVLQRVIPPSQGTLEIMGGIVMIFNKRPVNFRTEPSHVFYFTDELETWHFRNVSLNDIPLAYLDSSVLILGPAITPVAQIDVYWGKTLPQESVRLIYSVTGPP